MEKSLFYTRQNSLENEIDSFLRENLPLMNDSILEDYVLNKNYAHKLFSNAQRYECYSNGVLVGLVAAYFNDETNVVYIPYVCVSSYFQHQGIAKQLFENLFLEAISNDYKKVALEVLVKNDNAQSLYRKLGFYKCSEQATPNKYLLEKVL